MIDYIEGFFIYFRIRKLITEQIIEILGFPRAVMRLDELD